MEWEWEWSLLCAVGLWKSFVGKIMIDGWVRFLHTMKRPKLGRKGN